MPTSPPTDAQLRRQPRDYRAERLHRMAQSSLAQGVRLRSSALWRRARARVLSVQPLCADPYSLHADNGQTVLATEVDHLVSLQSAPHLALAESNLQGLCRACHAKKSGGERRVLPRYNR